MANREYTAGTVGVATSASIAITPSFAENITIAGLFVNSNSAISSPTATHSVSGALTTEIPLISGFGQMVVFSGVNLGNGTITINWSGGGVGVYSFAVSVDGGTAIRATNSATASSGAISLGVAGVDGDDVLGFFGARFGSTISTTDTQIGIDTTTDANALVTYDPYADGYTVDVTSDGAGTALTALAIQVAAALSITPSDPVVDGAQATITTSGLSGAITATLGGYSLTTAGTLPNLTYTTDIASITANGPVSAPRIGESLTLSVTGDEGTATSTVATQAAAGMAAITLAGTLANEADSLIDGMQTASGLTVAVGDIMYYPTADTTSIAATGALTTDSESFTLILIQGGSATTAGNAYAFTVTPEAVTPAADDWPFSKGIRPTAPVTWTWGSRHPLTGMRVRKFNG